MAYSLDQVESEIKANFDDYWSLFLLTAENEKTSFEWARSQLFEVVEALFWVVYENPKKLKAIDSFVLNDWLSRVRSGRDYYMVKEDVLLLLTFALGWSSERICKSLKISRSAYYFRLFQTLKLRNSSFYKSSGHVSRVCAHFDLRLPEYLSDMNTKDQNHSHDECFVKNHTSDCIRCADFLKFSLSLSKDIKENLKSNAPEGVLDESLKLFNEIKTQPVKRSVWSKIPVTLRAILIFAILTALGYWAFKS